MKRSKKALETAKFAAELDRLVKQIISRRDVNDQGVPCCCRCGRTSRLSAAHILAKGHYKRMRWDPLNVMLLCDPACHLGFWHKRPHDAAEWFDAKYPGRMSILRIAAACARKIDKQELLIGLRVEAEG